MRSRSDRQTSDERSIAGRVIGALFGGLIGLSVGAVVVLNLFIFAGTEQGYEATFDEVFADRPLVAMLALAVIVSFPIIGAIVGSRRRTG